MEDKQPNQQQLQQSNPIDINPASSYRSRQHLQESQDLRIACRNCLINRYNNTLLPISSDDFNRLIGSPPNGTCECSLLQRQFNNRDDNNNETVIINMNETTWENVNPSATLPTPTPDIHLPLRERDDTDEYTSGRDTYSEEDDGKVLIDLNLHRYLFPIALPLPFLMDDDDHLEETNSDSSGYGSTNYLNTIRDEEEDNGYLADDEFDEEDSDGNNNNEGLDFEYELEEDCVMIDLARARSLLEQGQRVTIEDVAVRLCELSDNFRNNQSTEQQEQEGVHLLNNDQESQESDLRIRMNEPLFNEPDNTNQEFKYLLALIIIIILILILIMVFGKIM